MVIKGSYIIGLKVYTLEKGKKLGEVKDILYDPSEEKIQALLLEGGLFGGDRFILFEDINSIGKDAVIINSEKNIKKESEVPENVEEIAKHGVYLTKNKVITEDGTDLGNIVDIYFDSKNGKVESLIVSSGTLNDIRSGKKKVSVTDIVTIGEDAIIVRKYTEDKFEIQSKREGLEGSVNQGLSSIQENIQKLINKSNEKIKDLEQELRTQTSELKENPKTKETIDSLKKQIEDLRNLTVSKYQETKTNVHDQLKKEAIGKYLSKNILLQNDTIFAERGVLITNKLIQEAEDNDVLDQVLANSTNEIPIENQPSQSISHKR